MSKTTPARAVAWVELDDLKPEPEAGTMVLTDGGTVWVRPKAPGQPDTWYRVGGGRGDSQLAWEDITAMSATLFVLVQGPPPRVPGSSMDEDARP